MKLEEVRSLIPKAGSLERMCAIGHHFLKQYDPMRKFECGYAVLDDLDSYKKIEKFLEGYSFGSEPKSILIDPSASWNQGFRLIKMKHTDRMLPFRNSASGRLGPFIPLFLAAKLALLSGCKGNVSVYLEDPELYFEQVSYGWAERSNALLDVSAGLCLKRDERFPEGTFLQLPGSLLSVPLAATFISVGVDVFIRDLYCTEFLKVLGRWTIKDGVLYTIDDPGIDPGLRSDLLAYLRGLS